MPGSRMLKEDYIDQLVALGEEPPQKWTVPELKMRLSELREEKGLPKHNRKAQTPFRSWVINMNKCRKKSELIAFAKDHCHAPLTGNETMEQLQKICIRRIYEMTQPQAEDPVGFGVHCALSYEELCMHQPEYASWVKKTASEGKADYRLLRLARWLEALDQQLMTEAKQMPTVPAVPRPAHKGTKSVHSAGSTASSSVNEELLMLVRNLQEDVAALKEERPRKKIEPADENMSNGSFRVVTP
eukprot:s1300_g15.t1